MMQTTTVSHKLAVCGHGHVHRRGHQHRHARRHGEPVPSHQLVEAGTHGVRPSTPTRRGPSRPSSTRPRCRRRQGALKAAWRMKTRCPRPGPRSGIPGHGEDGGKGEVTARGEERRHQGVALRVFFVDCSSVMWPSFHDACRALDGWNNCGFCPAGVPIYFYVLHAIRSCSRCSPF